MAEVTLQDMGEETPCNPVTKKGIMPAAGLYELLAAADRDRATLVAMIRSWRASLERLDNYRKSLQEQIEKEKLA